MWMRLPSKNKTPIAFIRSITNICMCVFLSLATSFYALLNSILKMWIDSKISSHAIYALIKFSRCPVLAVKSSTNDK